MRLFGVRLGAVGGTSFVGDLSGADFSQADLRQSNLSRARLDRANFHGARQLERAHLDGTILESRAVRDLLVSGQGAGRNYDGLNLAGANLDGADLAGASFRKADLSGATLRGANLEGANLSEANCTGADFTGARMTGAILESWNLDARTELEEIDCRYVFTTDEPNPRSGQRDRLPHDPDYEFQPGEFETLYREALKHIEILLRKGITREGWQAVLEEIAVKHPGVKLVGLRDAGDSVHSTWEAPDDAEPAQVERTIRENWEVQYLLASQEARLLGEHMRRLEGVVEILAENPRSLRTKKVTTNNLTNSGTVGAVNFGSVNGDVRSLIRQYAERPEPEARELSEALDKLVKLIEADKSLRPEEKAAASQQLATDKLDRGLAYARGLASSAGDIAKAAASCLDLWTKLNP